MVIGRKLLLAGLLEATLNLYLVDKEVFEKCNFGASFGEMTGKRKLSIYLRFGIMGSWV